VIRKAFPFLVIATLFLIGALILNNPPESSRRGPPPARAMSVEVIEVAPSAYQVTLASYGSVQPRTQSQLIAQVGGQIMSVSDNLREGGFFSKGDVLLQIDPRDFEANVSINEATLADAQQRISEEQARADQAARDWQRLGNKGEPTDLVLRKPQLSAARARLESARASLQKSRLDLERSTVRAPYDGRVLEQRVDLGQVVNPGNPLATVYATDFVEVRLPLRNSDLKFFDLPEGEQDPDRLPDVELYSDLGERQTWLGKVVRTEGAIDATARQLHVVAQVDDPFSTAAGRRPLKIGEYVTASLTGRQLIDARVIPVNTIYQNSFLYIVEEGVLQRRDVELLWQNDREALVGAGIEFGESLVTTPLGQVTSGMAVRIKGESAEGRGRKAAGGPGQRPPRGAPPKAGSQQDSGSAR